MDLTTLITTCALTVDPQVMHALIWHQSGGEPWAFTVSGRREPQVLQSAAEAAETARAILPANIAIRVGLTGLPATPKSVTVAMFTPCSNIALAARQMAQLTERCKKSSSSKGDPIYCAVAAWHGSWERPDDRFADAVRTSVANKDMPDFEMPAEAGIETANGGGSQPSDGAAAATPSATPDRERARQSPLFPVMSQSSVRSQSDHPASDQPAGGEQKTDAPTVHLTATQPRPDGLFVPRSAPRSPPDRNDDIPKFDAELEVFKHLRKRG
jgi:hypothetical protein